MYHLIRIQKRNACWDVFFL